MRRFASTLLAGAPGWGIQGVVQGAPQHRLRLRPGVRPPRGRQQEVEHTHLLADPTRNPLVLEAQEGGLGIYLPVAPRPEPVRVIVLETTLEELP